MGLFASGQFQLLLSLGLQDKIQKDLGADLAVYPKRSPICFNMALMWLLLAS